MVPFYLNSDGPNKAQQLSPHRSYDTKLRIKNILASSRPCPFPFPSNKTRIMRPYFDKPGSCFRDDPSNEREEATQYSAGEAHMEVDIPGMIATVARTLGERLDES
jgi:hypothetical protein